MRPWRAEEFGRFCRGEPRDFGSWPAEFGKIFREKLWALVIKFCIYSYNINILGPTV